jgi:hypothetical protein
LSVRQEGNAPGHTAVDFYNLDAIISVGYRVKSAVATRFRIWATQKLREFIVKGFVLDDERLKNPDQPFDYFEELLRRIQDIRTSERRFYQKITDIYATSIDYDPTQPESIEFFQTVQNKMHWAITGQTAAEIIHARADATKPNMGLTNWRGAKVRKEDVTIAKNYLNEPELAALNNLVEQYLIFAEGQAMRRVPMHMRDWIAKLHGFLTINDRNILTMPAKSRTDGQGTGRGGIRQVSTAKRVQQADQAGGNLRKPSNNCRHRPNRRKREGRNEPRNPQSAGARPQTDQRRQRGGNSGGVTNEKPKRLSRSFASARHGEADAWLSAHMPRHLLEVSHAESLCVRPCRQHLPRAADVVAKAISKAQVGQNENQVAMELIEVCDLIIDCEHKTAPTQETGFPSIRTPNIGRGRFILDGVNRVSEETYELWTHRAVPQPGDLIMAREAPVGNVAMIPEGLRPCLGQRTLLIRPDFPRFRCNGGLRASCRPTTS